jgi:hypothetical protein
VQPLFDHDEPSRDHRAVPGDEPICRKFAAHARAYSRIIQRRSCATQPVSVRLLSPTSALERITDSSQTSRQVRNVPTADMRRDMHLTSAPAGPLELLSLNSHAKFSINASIRHAGRRFVLRHCRRGGHLDGVGIHITGGLIRGRMAVRFEALGRTFEMDNSFSSGGLRDPYIFSIG